jgi:plasmid maintenance system antidote protein VapI
MIDNELREALAADGRTIYELAAAMCVEPDVLYRFRDGKDIRLATAAKLAEVLGLALTKPKAKRKTGGNKRAG